MYADVLSLCLFSTLFCIYPDVPPKGAPAPAPEYCCCGCWYCVCIICPWILSRSSASLRALRFAARRAEQRQSSQPRRKKKPTIAQITPMSCVCVRPAADLETASLRGERKGERVKGGG